MSAVNADGSDLVKDETTLVYTSAPGYFGQDALTFEVTDGTGPDDPEGRKATLSIPITVLPPDNQPPEFVGSQINVAPGEPATVVDLAALTNDPDPEDKGKHDYSLVDGEGKGISARIDGDELLVEASSSAKKGAATTLTLRVTDGETEPVEGAVLVQVTASNRAMPAANTDTIAEADQGKTVTVPVLANDFNPFPETPLKLLSANVETGAGSVSVAGRRRRGHAVRRLRRHPGGEVHDPGCHGGCRPRGDRSGRPHGSGRSRRAGCADGDERAGSHRGGLVRRPVEQRRRDHEVHREIGSGECVLEGVPVDHLHPRRADEQRRVRVPGDGHEPGGGVGAVGFVGGRASGRAARHPATRRRWPSATGRCRSPGRRRRLRARPWSGTRWRSRLRRRRGSRRKRSPATPSRGRAWRTAATTRCGCRRTTARPSRRAGATGRRPRCRQGPRWQGPAPTTAELAPVGAQAQMQVNWATPPANGDAIDAYRAGGVGGIHPAEDVDARRPEPTARRSSCRPRRPRTRTGSAVTTRRAGASAAPCRRRAAASSRPRAPQITGVVGRRPSADGDLHPGLRAAARARAKWRTSTD